MECLLRPRYWKKENVLGILLSSFLKIARGVRRVPQQKGSRFY